MSQAVPDIVLCLNICFLREWSNYLITNLAFVRPVGKALLVNIARDVDLIGSGWNSLCTGKAKLNLS